MNVLHQITGSYSFHIFSYAPDSMDPSNCVCAVAIRREDGEPWDREELQRSTGDRDANGVVSQIRWVFPVKGVPQSTIGEEKPLIIECEVGKFD